MTVFASLAPYASGENGDTLLALRQKLSTEFALTKTTADRTDIVTPGSVVVLHKDGLLMYSVEASSPASNIYKGGRLSHGMWPKCPAFLSNYCSNLPEQPASRTFVAGEKFWVTGVEVQPDSVVLAFYSDPYQDGRYYGRLKIALGKGQALTAEDTLKIIAEVVTVQPSENQPDPPPAPTTMASVTPGSDRLSPIAPPPPPADAPPPAPKEIAAGEPKDKVIETFGPPQKVVKLPSKEVDFYPDMKVTFVSGRVSNVDVVSTQEASSKIKQ